MAPPIGHMAIPCAQVRLRGVRRRVQPAGGALPGMVTRRIGKCISRMALSQWAPWAKLCGRLLNINCALLAVRAPPPPTPIPPHSTNAVLTRARQLPVTRSVIRYLNNVRIGDTGSLSQCEPPFAFWASGLCKTECAAHRYLPLRRNIEFHRMLGVWVAVLSWFHTAFHVFNFTLRPVVRARAWGNVMDRVRGGGRAYARRAGVSCGWPVLSRARRWVRQQSLNKFPDPSVWFGRV